MALQKTDFVGERGLCLAGTHRPSFSTCSIVHDGLCGFHPHIQATQHAWTCIISSATGDLFLLEEVRMQPSNCIRSCLTAVKYCSNACLLKESIQPVKASGGISTCRFRFWVIRRTSQQPICPRIQLFKCFPIQQKGKLDEKDPTDNPSHYLADTCCIILLPPPELGTSSLWCRNLDDVISIRWSWDLKLISNSKEGSKLQHHCLDNFWLRQHLIRQCRTAVWGKLRLATIFCMKSNNCTTKDESVHSQQPTKHVRSNTQVTTPSISSHLSWN